MPDWTAFGAVAGLVLALVLGLARVTTASMTAEDAAASSSAARSAGDGRQPGTDAASESAPGPDTDAASDTGPEPAADALRSDGTDRPPEAAAEQSAGLDRRSEVGGSDEASEPQPDAAVDVARDPRSEGRTTGSRAEHAGGRSDRAESAPVANGDSTPPASPAGSGQIGTDPGSGLDSISTLALFVNVLLTHGVLAVVLIGAAALTEIPAAALGVTPAPWSTGVPAVLGGLGLGVALAVANGALAANLDRFGVDYSDDLRTSLAPDSTSGWVVLLVVVLPLIALFEELLFRGVLVGAAVAATGLSPWLFVVGSSIAFAMGHGIQGRGGILVTGSLGAVLAAAFVLSESLLLVIVAHYVVNAAEFLLHELLGVDVREWLAV